MSAAIVAALIGLGGALVGATIQWVVARATIRSETERLLRQLSTEFKLQQFSEWQAEFRSVMSALLANTDSERRDSFNKSDIVQLVLKAQLLLNPNLPSHARVNGLVNQLALKATGWHGPQDLPTVLAVHSELLEAARETMFLPGK